MKKCPVKVRSPGFVNQYGAAESLGRYGIGTYECNAHIFGFCGDNCDASVEWYPCVQGCGDRGLGIVYGDDAHALVAERRSDTGGCIISPPSGDRECKGWGVRPGAARKSDSSGDDARICFSCGE